jgi:hypothetical protein
MADRLPPATWRRRRTSIALICIGLLMLVSSGLCSAFFGVGFLRDINQPGEAGMYARGFIWVVLLFGGPPMLVGLALLFWGLRRDRRG